ncbi:acetyl esterase [Caulobacter ginsengisoli]|uniref:Acetyl esterase n=1 Tax=Caulobacter ginsengisoli TaxID=400775 RepID=A0ABU0IL42_9CAUL|nr:alpha/beta hydrolase [Caulobacter ginsengisoli]MDQ0462725.1 acetyl esterase [Caulobacter ginsengisoli]
MNQEDLATLPARLHGLGLERVRQAVNHLLTGRDKSLPGLARIDEMRLPGAAGGLKGRFYLPHDAKPGGPLMVFFHGGGFVLGGPMTHEAFCIRLAAASGWRIISASYRLAPDAPFPAQLDDALKVMEWARGNAHYFGAGKVVVGGDSAGGWLAATAAAQINAAEISAGRPGAIAAQALVYPLVDMDDEAWAETLFRDGRIVGRLAVAYIRTALTCDAPSLMETVGPGTPPTLLLIGGPLDPVRPDVERYGQALTAAGVSVIVRRHDALPHGFINLTHLSAQARDAVADAGAQLKILLP